MSAGQTAVLLGLKPAVDQGRQAARRLGELSVEWGISRQTIGRYLAAGLPKRYGGTSR